MTQSMITSHELSELKAKLLYKKDILVSTFKEETMYCDKDIECLWEDLMNFIDNFLSLMEKILNKWDTEAKFYQTWERHSKYMRIPWGKVLICSPGNAPIPLIPMQLLSFATFGNEIILSPNRKTQKTAKLLYEIVEEIIGHRFTMMFYENGCKNALKKFVETGKVDLLYYLGSSKFRNEIYIAAYSNGVDVIYEGEGNVVAIIGSDINAETMSDIIENLFSSKTFCGGQMCTSPNTIFIHKDISSDFINKYIDLGNTSEYISSITKGQIDQIKSLINNGISKGYITKIHPENYTNDLGIKPSLIEISNINCMNNYLNFELYSPLAFFVEYDDMKDVIKILKRYWKFGLQVSLFSHDESLATEIINSLATARITQNMNPTYQNSLLPWGCYKLSGFSQVINFLEKASKPIIVEGNIRDEK